MSEGKKAYCMSFQRSRRAERSYSTFKVRRGGSEEIPLIQGKEQRLHFAGAASEEIPHVQSKRNLSKTVGVARGHQRTDTLKPQSQKTSQSDHMDHILSGLSTITCLSWVAPHGMA